MAGTRTSENDSNLDALELRKARRRERQRRYRKTEKGRAAHKRLGASRRLPKHRLTGAHHHVVEQSPGILIGRGFLFGGRYWQSKKGRNTIKRANRSLKHREAQKRYWSSLKGQQNRKRYRIRRKARQSNNQLGQANAGRAGVARGPVF
jgi:hypothetical protein